ncbi:MAG: serine dehydratase subunit alpha family protein [Bacteroidetes bacterium]|nr:serine dehydratase subunit alpha family protein [Bacteroidota bacterium]
MQNSQYQNIVNLLKKELKPALGCTEPIAVAIASAKAKETLGKLPEKIKVFVSGNIFKNGMGVLIPGTKFTGLDYAAALGVTCGNSELGLEVLKNIDSNSINVSEQLVNDHKITVEVKENVDKLYIETICYFKNDCSRVIIEQRHTNIVKVEHNEKILFEKEISTTKTSKETDTQLSVKKIYDFITNVDIADIEFLLEGAEMNKKIALEGIKGDYGLQVGKKIFKNIDRKILLDGLLTHTMGYTAAASDARMGGCPYPAMSNSGSGNQGITTFVPVIVVAKHLNKSKEILLRALALSNLISIHIKKNIGQLSALCGIVPASTGASCGITYLLGGTYNNIVYSIKNMTGSIVGMICDGAKPACALKVSAGVNSAIQAALLSIDDIATPKSDGIIDDDVEKTIINISKIATDGMNETDKLILNIMSNK